MTEFAGMQLPKKTVGASNKMMSPVLPGKARPVPAAFARPSYSTIAQQKPLPKAPPVFRLRPTASAAQAKLARPVSSQPSKPVAPPVFKLSLLQRTVAPVNNSVRLRKPPQAPAVYRPQPPSAPLQAKPTTSPRDTGPVRVSAPMHAGKGSYRITAGSGSRQIGSVMVRERDKSSIEVTDLGVNSSHRKQGLGNALIASALRAGLQMGKTRVVLNSQDNGSGRLTQWYQSMGFARTGASHRGYPQLEATIGRVLPRISRPQLTMFQTINQSIYGTRVASMPKSPRTQGRSGMTQKKFAQAKFNSQSQISLTSAARAMPTPLRLPKQQNVIQAMDGSNLEQQGNAYVNVIDGSVEEKVIQELGAILAAAERAGGGATYKTNNLQTWMSSKSVPKPSSQGTYGVGGSNYFDNHYFMVTVGPEAFHNAMAKEASNTYNSKESLSSEHLGNRDSCVHGEIALINSYPGVQEVRTTQNCCLFCYGLLEARGYYHQELRKSLWPSDWTHDYIDFKLHRVSKNNVPRGNIVQLTFKGETACYRVTK